jgi:hypothetical protein
MNNVHSPVTDRRNAMPTLRIEIDRGHGWVLRSEGVFAGNVAEIEPALSAYAMQYPHRALLDGAVVATAEPKRGRR